MYGVFISIITYDFIVTRAALLPSLPVLFHNWSFVPLPLFYACILLTTHHSLSLLTSCLIPTLRLSLSVTLCAFALPSPILCKNLSYSDLFLSSAPVYLSLALLLCVPHVSHPIRSPQGYHTSHNCAFLTRWFNGTDTTSFRIVIRSITVFFLLPGTESELKVPEPAWRVFTRALQPFIRTSS